jgi:tRNA (guanine37-N1)-methyltransferase
MRIVVNCQIIHFIEHKKVTESLITVRDNTVTDKETATNTLSLSLYNIKVKLSILSKSLHSTMTKKKRNKSEKNTNDNDSSVPSFSIFDFVTLSSLLPPKPLVASVSSSSSSSTIINGNEKNENSKYSNSKDDNNNSYVYPVTDFPSISSFEVSMEFPALIVPVRRTNELRQKLKSIMLCRPLLSVIVELSDADDGELLYLSGANENRKVYRKIVLDPKRSGISCIPSSTSYNNDNSSNNTKMNDILKSLLEEEEDYGNNCRLGRHTITLSYDDWTTEEILTRLLVPEGIQEIPSAFEAVGHLAHVNLRKELLPYKYLVGKVLLEKNSPRIQTVVNKLGSIDTKYRTFGMEIIANSNGNGNSNSNNNEDDNNNWSDVVVKEEGCEYRLDFRKVYWNSRLGGEHRRLVQLIQQDAVNRINIKTEPQQVSSSVVVVADLMAGIGPFAIPLTAGTKMMMPIPLTTGTTKKMPDNTHNASLPIEVYANDLNPISYEYLVINAKRNKCDYINCNDDLVVECNKPQSCKLYVYNMDARAFCHQLQDRKIRPDHYIMNLPATALEFLDAFRGYPTTSSLSQQPQIHVHCFAPKDIQESRTEIWNRIETALGCSLDEKLDNVTIYPVRDVAPNKNMYCVSFRLPKAVSGLSRIQIISNQEEEEEEDQEEIESDSNKKRKTDC